MASLRTYNVTEGTTVILQEYTQQEVADYFGVTKGYISECTSKKLLFRGKYRITPTGKRKIVDTRLTARECEVILALCNCDMSAKAASAAYGMGNTTIWHHIRVIKEKKGLDPKNFYDLVKLLAIVKMEQGAEH